MIRIGLFVVLVSAGCASSAKFETKYAANESLGVVVERGAAKVGCHSETSFHGEEIRCPDDKSVNLIENGGHVEAECEHMGRGECEELLKRVFDTGSSGS